MSTVALRTTAKQMLAKGAVRPHTEPWEDRVTVGLATLTLFAVFYDGLLHNNSGKLDTFWSPAHICMYAGLTVLGGWIGLVFLRHQPKGRLEISMSAVPHGYGLALVALPFGIGVALVLDESALLIELDDVYWTEEGLLSVQIVFASMAMLSALAYMIRMLRQTEGQDSESDWEMAAKAWDDLQMIPGIGGGEPGIGL
jgi:hypothetical protein